MMNTTISPATTDDLPQLIELLHELFSQDLEFIPDAQKQSSGLELIMQNPDIGTILVLKNNNEVVGMVNLLYSVSTVLGGKVAVAEDMIIDSRFRRQGYGRILLGGAIEFAKENACLRLTLLTDHTNSAAIAFYQSFGFVTSPMIPMRLVF